MCLHCYGCKSYIGLMPLPCIGVDISITCHCLHEGKLSCCYSWQYGHLMLVLCLHEFCGKLGRKSYKWPSVKAGLQRNGWYQGFLTCIPPGAASLYQQMLLCVTVLVTPFNPCSHYYDGLYLHRHSWLIWSLSWQKHRQRKQYWKRKCTISFCSSMLFSFSYMPRLVRMLTLGLLRQNWWVWQLECGIILLFFLSWVKFFLGRCE